MTKLLRIICPTDFSDCSKQALIYAHALAKISGGIVDCVHVIDSKNLEAIMMASVYASAGGYTQNIENLREHAQDQLDKLVAREHFRGVELTAHLRNGNIEEEIAALAQEAGGMWADHPDINESVGWVRSLREGMYRESIEE